MTENSPKAVALEMIRSFDRTGRYLDSYADDAVWHFAPTAESPQWRRVDGKAARRALHHQVYDSATFLDMSVVQAVEDGNDVAVHYTFRMESPATASLGGRVRVEVTTFYSVRDGLIVAQKQFSGPTIPDTGSDEGGGQ